MLSRAIYRSRQFFTSLRPRVDPEQRDQAYMVLGSAERQLFESMTLRDQQHCLDVYRHLREMHADRDLLIAALLHDCGKGQIALWHRVVYVLLDASAPSVLRSIATPGPGNSWRQALYRCVHHPELGAQAAQQAGSTARVVQLIRGERTNESSEQLAALQAADDVV